MRRPAARVRSRGPSPRAGAGHPRGSSAGGRAGSPPRCLREDRRIVRRRSNAMCWSAPAALRGQLPRDRDRAAARLLDAMLGQMLFAIIQVDGAFAIPIRQASQVPLSVNGHWCSDRQVSANTRRGARGYVLPAASAIGRSGRERAAGTDRGRTRTLQSGAARGRARRRPATARRRAASSRNARTRPAAAPRRPSARSAARPTRRGTSAFCDELRQRFGSPPATLRTSSRSGKGGLAAQRADAAAATIAADLGMPVQPAPFRPVRRGLLLTGEAPLYRRARTPGKPERRAASAHRASVLCALEARPVVAAEQDRGAATSHRRCSPTARPPLLGHGPDAGLRPRPGPRRRARAGAAARRGGRGNGRLRAGTARARCGGDADRGGAARGACCARNEPASGTPGRLHARPPER